MVAEPIRAIPRTLGRMDLILLAIVAIVNINNVPPAAVFGWLSLALWGLAFAAFFVPEAVAVLELSKRNPGEGGIYVWIRQEFGPAHGFLAGWCYWINNVFYIPVVLVYMAGIFAFGGGTATIHLVDSRLFIGAVAFGWLAIITFLNIRGLRVGKWIQNIGGVGTALSVVLVLVAALVAWKRGVAQAPPLADGVGWGMLAAFSVMCNAMVGIELASTMGDEIRNPARDLRPAIMVAGAVTLASYVLVTAALLVLVPLRDIGVIQGIMQGVSAGAAAAGAPWLVAPIAILMGLSIGGSASAWFAGSSRVPFVAGLTSALPEALGRVHPKYGSPYVALATCAILAGFFTAMSLVGSSVAEAYQVLLKAAVVIQLVPFVYLFIALARIAGVGRRTRMAGLVGLVTTVLGIFFAFVPTADVSSVVVFEAKMAAGVLGPIAIGWYLYQRSHRRAQAA